MSEKFKEQAVDQFDKWSEHYEKPGFFQRHLFTPTEDRLIEKLASGEASDAAFRLLDVGCGTGKLIRRIADRFANASYEGVDLAPGMIKFASEMTGDRENLSFQLGDASERLPFPDGEFDYVTCCHSYHHYPDQAAAAREFLRVLKPDGQLWLVDSDINRFWGDLLHRILIGAYEKFQVHHFKAPALKEFLEHEGLDVEAQERHGKYVPWMLTIAKRQQSAAQE